MDVAEHERDTGCFALADQGYRSLVPIHAVTIAVRPSTVGIIAVFLVVGRHRRSAQNPFGASAPGDVLPRSSALDSRCQQPQGPGRWCMPRARASPLTFLFGWKVPMYTQGLRARLAVGGKSRVNDLARSLREAAA
jgi:hypothetical protein